MAELEEKLNTILNDKEAMGRIMALARSLTGEEQIQTAETSPPEGGDSPPQEDDLSDLLTQLNPEMIQTGLSILRQAREGEERSAGLLSALRPFVREDRRSRLDRAMELTRMARIFRAVLGTVRKGGREGV